MHYALDTSSPTEIRASISASAAEVDEAIRESGQDARLLLADRLAREVMEKEDISPVSHPMYEGGDLKPGSAYDFTARLAVLPPIELPDCSSLEVRLPEPGLEQEELRGVYLAMLRQFATVEEVSDGRPAKSGDIAVVDIEALAGGEKVPGMQGSDLPVRLDDSGGRLKEVRALAEGLRVGETANGTMSCPEEFPVESYRGKEVSLKVTLKELRCEKLPTLDEGFAKKLGFGSLRELETKVLKDAMGSKMAFIKARAGEELLNGILDKTDFPVPEPVRELFVRDEVLGGCARGCRRRRSAGASMPPCPISESAQTGMPARIVSCWRWPPARGCRCRRKRWRMSSPAWPARTATLQNCARPWRRTERSATCMSACLPRAPWNSSTAMQRK